MFHGRFFVTDLTYFHLGYIANNLPTNNLANCDSVSKVSSEQDMSELAISAECTGGKYNASSYIHGNRKGKQRLNCDVTGSSRHPKSQETCQFLQQLFRIYSKENIIPGPRFTNGFSIAIQIRWKFRFTLISILIHWSLQNFVQGTTAELSWHVQKKLLRSDGQ